MLQQPRERESSKNDIKFNNEFPKEFTGFKEKQVESKKNKKRKKKMRK